MKSRVSRRDLGRWMMSAAVAAIALVGLGRGEAAELTQPEGKKILSISGHISTTNEGGAADFDRDMLEGLGMTEFTSTTPWYDGAVSFQGVPMKDLMRVVGASGTSIVAYALNDYSVEIPIEDFERYGVILALKRDGEYMPVRDKGPLFIVYPYDSEPELKNQRFYSRSAWQVARIVVK